MQRIVTIAALVAAPACAGAPVASPAAGPVQGGVSSGASEAGARGVVAAPGTAFDLSNMKVPPGATTVAPGPAPLPSTAPSAPPPAEAPPPIPPGTAVLHIGDSFAQAGFAKALKPKFKALGVRYEVRAEDSTYTTTWAGRMELLVANTQPDLVIINLGANEVANIDPSAHAPAIRRIVKSIGGRPCVWVSPPSWRKDTGIQDVIRQSSAPCRYFDSDKLVHEPIPRQHDHIHPTDAGGAIWADAFWAWLQDQRAPASLPLEPGAKPSPWRLKPGAPEEHAPAGG